MTPEGRKLETPQTFTTLPPAVETLRATSPIHSLWPKDIQENPERIKEATLRSNATEALDAAYTLLQPGESMREALGANRIPDEALERVRTTLAEVMRNDSLVNRLALYIPFELLPDARTTSSESSAQFLHVYKSAWESLLSHHELRANYDAGDVMEQEHRTEPPQVVIKAAHLIPALLERGIITTEEVLTRYETSSDAVLRQSIVNALGVAQDKGLLSDDSLKRMASSMDPLLANVSQLSRTEKHGAPQMAPVSPESVFTGAEREWEETSSRLAHETMSANRRTWLEKEARRNIIETSATRLATLSSGDLLTHASSSPLAAQVAIEAARMTLERAARAHDSATSSLVASYAPLFTTLSAFGAGAAEAATRAWYHLHSLGVVSESVLRNHGLATPHVEASGDKAIEAMSKEIATFTTVAKRIEASVELSKILYPIVVLAGSRVKGYAMEGADLDLMVFVRPGTPESDRARLQASLSAILPSEQDKAMEFWLAEDGDALTIQNYENPDPQRGDITLPHPLLGVWCGNRDAIAELYQKLMPQYVHSQGKKILGEEARKVWLEEMERDILQYRLLHKGYDRVYASEERMHTPHSNAIDGESAFFDPGYRRLATKLYLEKVFLPELS